MPQEKVIEDANFLISNIEKFNPALYRYNPDFIFQSSKIISSITDSLTLLQYFSFVSQICACSNEGHFQIGNWKDVVHRGFLDNSYRYLPFKMKVLSGEIIVLANFTRDSVLNSYDKVLSINGISSADILDVLYKHVPSDGHIMSNLEQKVSTGFSWMYYLFVEQPSIFDIEFQSYGSDHVQSISVQALTRAEQIENLKMKADERRKGSTASKSINEFYELNINESYAYLMLKSFNHRLVDRYKLKPKKLYADIFGKLNDANVKKLIIDLRNNTGGRNVFADEMISFILKGNAGSYLKSTISWNGKRKSYKLPKRSKHVYSGDIVVLTNGSTYSAAASLARYLREYGNAYVIGEETGSRYEGYVAGSTEFISLPNSAIQIGIPRYLTYYPDSNKQSSRNRGLIPDLIVRQNVNDLKENNDRVLNVAIDFVSQ